MTMRIIFGGLAALAALACAMRAEASVENGVRIIRGPGPTIAESNVESAVRVWRGERAQIEHLDLAGGGAAIPAAPETRVVVIHCGRRFNRLRTQGFYSGRPGAPSRRYTQGFYSGGPDYRRCARA